MKIDKELMQLEVLIQQPNALNTDYSAQTGYWHIDHSLKVIIGISTMLKKSNPELYKHRFNFRRFVIFSKKKIPRGAGNAPKGVMATTEITKEDLLFQLDKAKKLLEDVAGLPKKHFFRHSVFGNLNVKRSLFFMALHTHHHIKIVEDILK